MCDELDELGEGFLETTPELLLELALYGLEDTVVTATEVSVSTLYCTVKLVEPDIVILKFNDRFGMFAYVDKKDWLKIKQSYIAVDHEVERIRKLN